MNNVNFYIHGVPKGQDIWGIDQDRDYIKSFYASYSEQVKFVVEVIPAKKRSFYTYVRGKNVFGFENRDGSYFGMTISFDGVYCTDTKSLYRLFENFFEKRILGLILTKNNNGFRYSTSSFEGKSKDLENLRGEFFHQLTKFKDDLEEIDSSFVSGSNNQVVSYNIIDVDSTSFFETLKKKLRIYVSAEYLSKDNQIANLNKQIEPEKEKNKKLTEENVELQNKIKTLSENKTKNEAELAQLRIETKKIEEERNNLKKKIVSLKSELERNKAKSSIEKSVGQIKQPLDELLRGVHRLVPDTNDNTEDRHYHSHRTNGIRMLIRDIALLLILLLLICLCVFQFFNVKILC